MGRPPRAGAAVTCHACSAVRALACKGGRFWALASPAAGLSPDSTSMMTSSGTPDAQMGPDIAAVIPHFQRKPGLLPQAVRSVFAQTLGHRAVAVICDDESPISAESEIRGLADLPQDRIIIIRGGAIIAEGTRAQLTRQLMGDPLWELHLGILRHLQCLEI